MKKITLLLLAILITNFAFTQYKAIFKTANSYYTQKEYASAIQVYQQLLDDASKQSTFTPYTLSKKTKRIDTTSKLWLRATYELADSYFQTYQYAKAHFWLQKLGSHRQEFPQANLQYIVSLRATNQFKAAKEVIISSLQKNSKDVQLQKELSQIEFIEQQYRDSASSTVQIAHFPILTNDSIYGAFAPFVHQQQFFFTKAIISKNDAATKNASKQTAINQIHYKTIDNNGNIINDSSVHLLFPPSTFQEGNTSFTNDGKTIYFTRWMQEKDKTANAVIYWSKKNDSGYWQTPVAMNEQVNTGGFNAQHPFVTSDQRYLFFSSNKPKGKGKYDIWVAKLNAKGDAETVTNLAAINTKEDDVTPFYSTASQTLTIASNGRIGMGGFDLFMSKGSLPNNFSEVKNLGFPINSVKDDLYFFSANTTNIFDKAYFSSDRGNDCCLEIYQLEKKQKNVFVYYATPDTIASNLQQIAIQKDSSKTSLVAATKNDTTITNMQVQFAFNSAVLDSTAKASLDLILQKVQSKQANIVIIGHTDSKGTDSYNMNLSMQRAKASANYLIQKGWNKQQIKLTAIGEQQPVEPNEIGNKDNPSGRALNRRVEIKIE